MGLGQQLTEWSEEVLKQLADEGHFVIVYDNRDTGLSSKIEEAGVPDIAKMQGALIRGEKFKAPYTFSDMSDDAVGLLDALGIEKAHIYGWSHCPDHCHQPSFASVKSHSDICTNL
jgi:pimeloyl-ACP methyl ester carboxylesterase